MKVTSRLGYHLSKTIERHLNLIFLAYDLKSGLDKKFMADWIVERLERNKEGR